ncbi:MAG TPA: DUF4926 domain-containing protein [Caulobacteraceae bacterium]
MLQLLDVVALLVDHPELSLSSGQVGTIVHVHDDETFEVEFSDDDGVTYALVDLKAPELLKLRYDAEAAA